MASAVEVDVLRADAHAQRCRAWTTRHELDTRVPQEPVALGQASHAQFRRLGQGVGIAGRAFQRGARCRRQRHDRASRRRPPRSPSRVVAVVGSTGTRHPAGRGRNPSISFKSRTVRPAAGRSPLLTTRMSAISRMPALEACTSSPSPGGHTTMLVSANDAIRRPTARRPPSRRSPSSKPATSQQVDHCAGRARQAARMAARGQRPDENALVARRIRPSGCDRRARRRPCAGWRDRSRRRRRAGRAPAAHPAAR